MGELLYKLKEWLTVPDAATHLSMALVEDVTEADVLQLALDGQLTLSVNFVNPTSGQLGRLVRRELVEDRRARGNPFGTMSPVKGDADISESEVFQIDRPDAPFALMEGVWDLAMIGNERNDISSHLQTLLGGPELNPHGSGDAFVTRPDGTWCRLFDREEDELGVAFASYPTMPSSWCEQPLWMTSKRVSASWRHQTRARLRRRTRHLTPRAELRC